MGAERAVLKSDAALVVEAKEGNEGAFGELVRRHMEKAVTMAYVAVGNYEDARDLSQEAFVKAYRCLKNFEMKSQFSTWFYRILMNTAKDFLRKKKWQKFLVWKSPERMESFFSQLIDLRAQTGQGLLQEELKREISGAIEKLPLKQRWIFTLRFLEGLSLQEISEVTELSEGTVKATIHFAVEKFAQAVRPYVSQGGPHGL